MRLLFIVHQFLPEFSSGTEQVALNLAKAAQRAGHRADILTCSLDPGADWVDTTPEGFRRTGVQGLEVTGIPAAILPEGPHGFAETDARGERALAARWAKLDAALDGFLERGRYDLVHVVHAMRMLHVIGRLHAAGLPYVLTLTDFFLVCYRVNLVRVGGAACAGPDGGRACAAYCQMPGLDLLALEQRQAAVASVLRNAAIRVACSRFVAEAFSREHPGVEIRVIGHGIDLLRMSPRRPRDDATIVFGYVGTMSRPKGVDILARAVAAVPNARIRLDLFGPFAGDDLFVAEMRQLAAGDQRIRLPGAIPASEVPAALAGFDVLCLPTRLPETFSLALHEGFAAGLPALVADLGHPPGVVRDAGCGLVLPQGDTAAWSGAIADIAADPSKVDAWRARLPLPARVEEETFLYSQLYRACIAR